MLVSACCCTRVIWLLPRHVHTVGRQWGQCWRWYDTAAAHAWGFRSASRCQALSQLPPGAFAVARQRTATQPFIPPLLPNSAG